MVDENIQSSALFTTREMSCDNGIVNSAPPVDEYNIMLSIYKQKQYNIPNSAQVYMYNTDKVLNFIEDNTVTVLTV